MGQDRVTCLSILKNAKFSQYAWSSATIDNIDISQSLAAVGREIRFPLDIELNALPELNGKSKSTLHNYLWDVSSDAEFSTSVVQVLVEEQRQAHRH